MRDKILNLNIIELKPNFLWFLTLTYAMVIVLANWFDPRLIKIFGLITDAGTLIFPLTFLLSDLITEVYGYKHARRAIWCGFLFNALFIMYGQLVIHMPSPDYPTNNQLFDTLFATNIRIIIASSISYLISEPLNSFVMAKLKIQLHGRYLAIRFLSSTIIAAGADSVIFSVIAFFGVMSNSNLTSLIITMWFIKVVIEIIGLPISIRLAKKLKQTERLDIYDKQTDFNLFTLDANYTDKDNEFGQES
jgi:uncharacterized integral membrane protein (TIGR00697 family)